MFILASNLDEVIAQTERLIEDIPIAMERALAPELWIEEARSVATRVIMALASAEEQEYVKEFVATITALALQGGGLSLSMRSPLQSQSLGDAQGARAAVSYKEMAQGQSNLFMRRVVEFEDAIHDWVETEKRKDARDLGKTDEDIAHVINYILLSPNLGEKGKAAREKLTPHIVAWMQQKQRDLAPERSDEWLRAVLSAWRDLVRTKYPGMVRQMLRG